MINLNDILALDEHDPLASKKQDFALTDDLIYLDGNSLGVLPKKVKQVLTDVVETQWGKDLISSWNKHSWIDLPVEVGEQIAPLVGAKSGQVICCDSISVNLIKVLSAALKLQPGRTRILSQTDNFPTDLYIAQGLSELLGREHCELTTVEADQIIDALDESIAVVMLTQVNFRTGAVHDMHALTAAAHEMGALVIWDLAHSAGALPISLDEAGVDFAVGCGYKYFNGGPGAPAFIYAAERHLGKITQPISGWMGHANPFAFDPGYRPANDIRVFLSGTPNILSMKALEAAMTVFDDVDMRTMRDKSLALSDTFLACLTLHPCLEVLECVSPLDHQTRGSQLAFKHPHAYAIVQALIEQQVVADFRAPDILRVGFTPLYLSYHDIWQAVSRLADIMASEGFMEARFHTRHKVT